MKRLFLIVLMVAALLPTCLKAQESWSIYRPLSVGFEVGVGGMLPTGSLADDFKGSALFTGGIHVGYKRLRLAIDVGYSQPSFKNMNPYNDLDIENRDLQLCGTASATLLAGTLRLGYTVWQQGRFSVTPSVGLTTSRLSWDINHIKYENDDEGTMRPSIEDVTDAHENNIGWTASVDFDIKLHNKPVNVNDETTGHYTSSIRLTPFVTHASYSHFTPSVKGCCVGLTVGYSGLFRFFQ